MRCGNRARIILELGPIFWDYAEKVDTWLFSSVTFAESLGQWALPSLSIRKIKKIAKPLSTLRTEYITSFGCFYGMET